MKSVSMDNREVVFVHLRFILLGHRRPFSVGDYTAIHPGHEIQLGRPLALDSRNRLPHGMVKL